MFARKTYVRRRERLKGQVGSGIVLLLGNDESPMNYAGNPYPFRQDSTFLYFIGIDRPGLAAVIDLDEGSECLFGDDPPVEEVVWTGPQPKVRVLAERAGVGRTAGADALREVVAEAVQKGRTVHFLPQYRPENGLRLTKLGLDDAPSESLIRAVVAQRSVKSAEEVEQIESAVSVCREMQVTAMRMARPGVVEREIVGVMEGIAIAHGGRKSFPSIFSIHGETLHNPYYGNVLKAGDIVVNDSGAESPLHYAADITRTIPVGGRFSERQRDIYSIVLDSQERALAAVRPGVEFREVHRIASVALVEGLRALGLLKGDPAEAVEAGVHTLFFQCGVGHMMGLDVHDMDALGEDYVGYTETIHRNPAFGWRSLRLAKAVEPGFVVTVEPGIYFIPVLIDRWRDEGRLSDFIDYERVDSYRDFGGIRLEDDVLVTQDGCRILGPPIPKTIDEVEALTPGS